MHFYVCWSLASVRRVVQQDGRNKLSAAIASESISKVYHPHEERVRYIPCLGTKANIDVILNLRGALYQGTAHDQDDGSLASNNSFKCSRVVTLGFSEALCMFMTSKTRTQRLFHAVLC